jgi:hypothetical protein
MTELVSTCQHLSSGTNVLGCEDQSRFKRFGETFSRLETTALGMRRCVSYASDTSGADVMYGVSHMAQ